MHGKCLAVYLAEIIVLNKLLVIIIDSIGTLRWWLNAVFLALPNQSVSKVPYGKITQIHPKGEELLSDKFWSD